MTPIIILMPGYLTPCATAETYATPLTQAIVDRECAAAGMGRGVATWNSAVAGERGDLQVWWWFTKGLAGWSYIGPTSAQDARGTLHTLGDLRAVLAKYGPKRAAPDAKTYPWRWLSGRWRPPVMHKDGRLGWEADDTQRLSDPPQRMIARPGSAENEFWQVGSYGPHPLGEKDHPAAPPAPAPHPTVATPAPYGAAERRADCEAAGWKLPEGNTAAYTPDGLRGGWVWVNALDGMIYDRKRGCRYTTRDEFRAFLREHAVKPAPVAPLKMGGPREPTDAEAKAELTAALAPTPDPAALAVKAWREAAERFSGDSCADREIQMLAAGNALAALVRGAE